jgi:hypothetical protein
MTEADKQRAESRRLMRGLLGMKKKSKLAAEREAAAERRIAILEEKIARLEDSNRGPRIHRWGGMSPAQKETRARVDAMTARSLGLRVV